MAQIIKFGPRKNVVSTSRVEALVKGRIEHYNCDTCGEDLEVIDGVYPKKCPGCGLEITQWNKAEED